MGTGTIFFAYSKNINMAYFGRFIIGFGASFNFLSLLRIQSNWFKEKEFPLLTGITIFIGNFGALFGLGPFSYLVDFIGFANSFLIFGIIPIIFGILIFLIVQDKPDNISHEKNKITFKETYKLILKNKNNYFTFFSLGIFNGIYIAFVGFSNIPFLMHVYNLTK